MDKKLKYIFEALRKKYPEPKTELHYSTPFQLMVAVILSAQTTDKQVNKVTEELFKYIKVPKDLVKFGAKKFEKAISGVNYYKTKAKNIFATAKILMNNEQGIMNNISSKKYTSSEIINELQKLSGIGIKSAKVIAHVLWDLPVIAVDTHVHRVVNRWGIIKTKTPDQTSDLLEKIVPKKYKDFAHHAIMLFGRYVCIARKPKCKECPLQKWCDYYKQGIMNSE